MYNSRKKNCRGVMLSWSWSKLSNHLQLILNMNVNSTVLNMNERCLCKGSAIVIKILKILSNIQWCTNNNHYVTEKLIPPQDSYFEFPSVSVLINSEANHHYFLKDYVNSARAIYLFLLTYARSEIICSKTRNCEPRELVGWVGRKRRNVFRWSNHFPPHVLTIFTI